MKKFSFLDFICILFAVLFVYAAVSKFITIDEFKAQIGKSPLITYHGWWISWFIPSIEVAIAVLLFIPKTQLTALYCAFTLMFIFTIYIGFMLAFTPTLPCSCGGILSRMGWREHLFFNIGFTFLGALGIVLHDRQKSQETIASGNVTFGHHG